MNLIEITTATAEGMVALGACIFFVGQYKAGKKEVKVSNVSDANETIELFKNQAEGFKADLAKLHTDFEAFKKEVLIKEDSYKKTISQQEDLIKTYGALLQNRNPELEKILTELSRTNTEIRDFLKDLKASSEKSNSILEEQNRSK